MRKTVNQSEKLIQEVLRFAPFVTFQMDLAGNAFFISEEWENIAGISVAESLDKGWHNALLAEDVSLVVSTIKACVADQKQTFSFRYRVCHPVNGIRHCQTDIRLVPDTYGDGKLLIGYVQDISEDRLTRERLIASENRQKELNSYLESLIASIEDIILEIDGDKCFRNVWVKDEAQLFMPKEEFIGKTVNEVFPAFAKLFAEPIDEVIRTGETIEMEYKHIDPTVERWYKAKITMVTNHPYAECQRLALIIQDITNKVKQKQALVQTQALLERTNQILESSQRLSNTGGWEFDVANQTFFWTRQTRLIFDIGERDVVSYEEMLSFCEIGYADSYDRHIRVSIEKQETLDFIFRIRNKKWLRNIGTPVMENGCVVKLRGATMDITEQMKATQQLREAKNKAEEAARAKTDFLSVMSHEIRTPLNGIIGISNLLKLNHVSGQQPYIDNLIFSADHLLRLINEILDLTKIDSGHVELVQHEVDLGELLRGITDQFRSIAQSKGIRLISHIDPKIPRKVVADATRLNQILNNLISNAVKYTDTGNVTVSLQERCRDQRNITVHFSITDTGIGIPEAYHETIFDSFKQIQQVTDRKHSGTGLGLSITKKLIELHDSQIAVKSTPGIGSTFYFDLVFGLLNGTFFSDSSVRSSVPSYADKLGGMDVLLVEDHPINAMVAQKQLAYFGIVPDCARDGKEALSLLDAKTYHVAFIDLHMPGMDGHVLSEIIRHRYPDIHIVISTADIMGDIRMKLSKVKTYDILNKPIVLEELLAFLLKVAKQKNILHAKNIP